MGLYAGLRAEEMTSPEQYRSPKKEFTDKELLDMRPAPDSDHETWRAYHQLLFKAGKLPPPELAK